MRPSVRILLALGALGAASLTATGVALAAPSQDAGEVANLAVQASPTGNPDQAEFDYEIDDLTCLDGSTITVDGVDATIDQTDNNSGTITFPVGTPGGSYLATFSCDTGKGTVEGTLTLSIAAVTVDKVVEGDVPADAVFPVTVACNQAAGGSVSTEFNGEGGNNFLLNASFSFDADGGSKYLVAYTPQSCSISEVDDAGALSATIDLADCGDGRTQNAAPAGEAAGPDGGFAIFDPTDCTQTITNVFATAAPPADVVQQQPAFTG